MRPQFPWQTGTVSTNVWTLGYDGANQIVDATVKNAATSASLKQFAYGCDKGVTPPPNEAQVDHIFPRSLGGPNTLDNAQVISREENLRKGNYHPDIDFH